MFERHDQLLVHQGAIDQLQIGKTHKCVVAEREEGFYRIRYSVRHGRKDGGRVSHITARYEVDVLLTPDSLRRLSQGLHAPVGERWMFLRTELFGFLNFRKFIVEFDFALGDDIWMKSMQDFSARDVKISRQCTKSAMQPNCRRAVSLLVCDRCPRNDAWSCGRIHACGRGNSVSGNSRDLCYALERKFVDASAKLFKSRGPLRYEVLVVETFVDDNFEPAHAHRGIGPGPQWEPNIR